MSGTIPFYHKSIALPNGDLYLIGGTDSGGKRHTTGSVYRLNWERMTLELINTLKVPRNGFGCVAF